jgi:hypothetical protein
VFVNMDETSVAFTFGGQKGNILVTKKEGQFRQRFVERLAAGERRTSVTLLTCLADLPEVHRELPQILLGSSNMFPGSFLAQHRTRMPEGVYLWANDRGWMTQEVCAVLLRAIHASLGALAQRYHVILLMDAHRAHISETICRRATALGITLVYVPAKLTWLLQPADTHLFAQFKNHLRRAYTQQRHGSPDGRVSKIQWLDMLASCITNVVLQRTWGHAFAANGITGQQQTTSLYVRSMAGLSREAYPTMQPTLEEVQYLYGMRNVPYDLLMVRPPAAPLPAEPDLLIPRARRIWPPPAGPADAADAAGRRGGRGRARATRGRGGGARGSAA